MLKFNQTSKEPLICLREKKGGEFCVISLMYGWLGRANDCSTEGLSVNTAVSLGFLTTINGWFQSAAASRNSVAHRSNYPSLDWSTGQLQATRVLPWSPSTWLCVTLMEPGQETGSWLPVSAAAPPQTRPHVFSSLIRQQRRERGGNLRMWWQLSP